MATHGEKKSEDTLTRFNRIHERERQTDGQTPHDGITVATPRVEGARPVGARAPAVKPCAPAVPRQLIQ